MTRFARGISVHEKVFMRQSDDMRAFAEAWPDAEIVQQAVGQLPWRHNLVPLYWQIGRDI